MFGKLVCAAYWHGISLQIPFWGRSTNLLTSSVRDSWHSVFNQRSIDLIIHSLVHIIRPRERQPCACTQVPNNLLEFLLIHLVSIPHGNPATVHVGILVLSNNRSYSRSLEHLRTSKLCLATPIGSFLGVSDTYPTLFSCLPHWRPSKRNHGKKDKKGQNMKWFQFF